MCGYYTLPGECGRAPQEVVIVVVRDDGACGSIPTVWQDAPRTLPASEASREAVEEPREAGACLSSQTIDDRNSEVSVRRRVGHHRISEVSVRWLAPKCGIDTAENQKFL